jgi:Na+/H+ antiporter NhaD/arsenite permease-like protein
MSQQNKNELKAALFGLTSFLAAWQATNFDLDYRALLGALTCATLGYVSPKKK